VAKWLAALLALGCSGVIDDPGGGPVDPLDPMDPLDPTDPTDPTDPPNPNDLPPDALFTCEGSPTSSPARLKRIDNEEFAASIGQPGGDARFNPLSADPIHQYGTFAEGETLDAVVLERFMDFAPESVQGWRGPSDCSCAPKPEGVSCIYGEGVPDTECVTLYVETYLRDFALFREPTAGEVERLVGFATSALESGVAAAQSRGAIVARINGAAWMTTGALFRSEMGRGADLGGGVRALSDEELGKALAYALTDHGPGARGESSNVRIGRPVNVDIADAVADGSISDPAVIEGIVAAHFGGVDEGRGDYVGEYWLAPKIARFFREWLGTDAFRTSFHDDPQATSGLDEFSMGSCSSDDDCPTKWDCSDNVCRPFVNGSYNNLKSTAHGREISLDAQLGEMIARIVVEDRDVLRNLLTSRTFFVPSSVSGGQKNTSAPQFAYGVTEPVPNERSARWRELPEDERAGILTHPAWLASHADNFENGTSAVHRGLWIRRNLLCGEVPDVPITVDAAFPEETDHLAARDRLAMATEDEYCQSCHSLMNPLGLPFEMYNHAGFLRAEDHGDVPDGSSTLVETGDPALDTAVRDAVEMSELFADSVVVEQCFVRQVFRYFAGRPETLEDACTLVAMQDAYEASEGSMQAMLVALFTSPAFLHRHDPVEEEGE